MDQPMQQRKLRANLLRRLLMWQAIPQARACADTGTAMMIDQSSSDTDDRPDPALLVALIDSYQAAYDRWQADAGSTAADLRRNDVRACVEQLWPLLRRILRPVAYEWVPRQQMQAVEPLSRYEAIEEALTSLCLEVIDHLPHIQINPQENPIGLLRTIARYHEIDAYRRYTRRYTLPADTATAQDDGTPTRRSYQLVSDESILNRCADECMRHFDDVVVEQAHARSAVEAIRAHWQATLSSEEHRILYARLIHEPPIPHADLAESFGPPWNSELVRMRYHRLLRRTQDFLRKAGLAE